MTGNKPSWSIFNLTFIVLVIVSLASTALLIVLIADELAEIGWAIPNFMQVYLAYRGTWQASTGNEFTGTATALLFGAASIPVGIDLISRAIIRYGPFGERVKGFFRRINNLQKKYLMPFHTYLSILALGLGLLHLALSSCVTNPLPELGLILSGIFVATGFLCKWKTIPPTFRKILYQLHTSLIVSGVLLVLLYAGHAVMDMD
jgi:hypothetical protein